MKKNLLTLMLTGVVFGTLAACSPQGDAGKESEPSVEVTKPVETTESAVVPESTEADKDADEDKETSQSTAAVLGQVHGKDVMSYTLENANGMKMVVSNYGCQVIELWVPDKDGKLADVLLAPADFEGLKTQTQSYGRVLGRFANRIGDATFELDGKTYNLEVNNADRNTIHGGSDNWGYRIWEAAPDAENQSITFSLYSPDGDAWFPGAVTVYVTYTLTDDNEWKIEYSADTTKTTLINLTNHAYFNLAGHNSGTINDHILQINADEITEVREDGVPTGEFLTVDGTAFDFREPKKIGEDIDSEEEQLVIRKGYDHNYVLNKEGRVSEPILAAVVTEEVSGRVMEVYTDQPGVQFYSANYLNGSTDGKDGTNYDARTALCLETQGFPDAIHHENFPSCVLTPEETYTSTTIYKFKTN